MTRFFLRLLNYALLALFLGSFWGGWYLSQQGFGRKWRKKLSEEFAKHGVEMSARRLTLDPMRGLVAHDVQVYRSSSRQDLIAFVSELRLDINYTRLLRNEPFLNGLTLSEAEVNLDVDPRKANLGEFTIHRLAAQLYFQPDKLEIRRFQGEGLGIQFSINGIVNHPVEWEMVPNQSNVILPEQGISREWLRALAEVHVGRKPGRLDLQFRADLRQKEWLQSAAGRLEIPEVRWKGLVCRHLTMEADLADRFVTLRSLQWKDDLGPVTLGGTWRPGEGGSIMLDSRGNAPAFFHEFQWLPDLSSANGIRLTGDFSWKEQPGWSWQMVGKLDATQLIYRSVMWDHARVQFSLSDGRYFYRGIEFQQKDGAVEGQLLDDRGKVSAELVSTVNPRVIWLSLGKDVPVWLEECEFGVNPWVRIQMGRSVVADAPWESKGVVVFGRTSFRGVSLTSAQADFESIGNALSLNGAQITRPEGQCTGEAFWNAATGELQFWDVRNTIDLAAISHWLDSSLPPALETLRLPRDTTLLLAGQLTWKASQLANGQFTLESDSLPLFDLPVLADLKKSKDESSEFFQVRAGVQLGAERLEIDPLVATRNSAQINGKGVWNLATKIFSGMLERKTTTGDSTTWRSDAPFDKPSWRQEDRDTNVP